MKTVGELVLDEIGGRAERGLTKRADVLLVNALTDLGIWDAEVLECTKDHEYEDAIGHEAFVPIKPGSTVRIIVLKGD